MRLEAFAKKKIKDQCTVKSFKLVAIALASSGHVICSATNKRATGGISEFSIHAEEALSQKLRKISAIERYGSIDILVMRVRKDGSFGMAKPCAGCNNLLTRYGIRNINYTDDEGKITKL